MQQQQGIYLSNQEATSTLQSHLSPLKSPVCMCVQGHLPHSFPGHRYLGHNAQITAHVESGLHL